MMEKYAARLSPFLTKLSGFSVHGGVCTIGGQQMNWLPHNEIYFASVQLFPLIYPAFVEFFPKINTEVSRVDICHFSFLFVNIFLSSIQFHMDFEYQKNADWNIFFSSDVNVAFSFSIIT